MAEGDVLWPSSCHPPFEHGEESQGAPGRLLGQEDPILLLSQPALSYRGCAKSDLDSENNVIHKASPLWTVFPCEIDKALSIVFPAAGSQERERAFSRCALRDI